MALLDVLMFWRRKRATGPVMRLPGWPDWVIGQPEPTPDETLAYQDAVAVVPTVYACVTLIQERIAALPLKFYSGDVEIEPNESGNIADLWNKANPRDTGEMMVMHIEGSLDTHGNAYLFKDYMGGSQVRELWVLPAPLMRPIPGPSRTVSGFAFDVGNGQSVTIPPRNIVHFRRWNPDVDALQGLSPIGAALLSAQTMRDQQKWLRNTYRNGGVVAGFFSTDQVMPPDEIKRLQSEMRARFGGPDNAGRSFIMPRNLKFERQALTMAELQFLEAAGYSAADIYRVFHIPPVIMGVKERGGLSDAGASTDMLLFYENCIIPRTRLITTVLNEMMLSTGEFGRDVTCEFDLSGVLPLQEVYLQQAKQLVEVTGGPILTPNEARDILGLPELDGDEFDTLRLSGSPSPATDDDDAEDEEDDDDAEPPAGDGTDAEEPTDGEPRQEAWRAARERALRVATVQMDMYERWSTRDFKRLFRQQGKRALAAFDAYMGGRATRDARPLDVGALTVEELLRLEGVDKRLIKRLIEAIVDGAGTSAVTGIAAGVAFDIASAQASAFIAARTSHTLSATLETTWKRMRDSLSEGVRAQETPTQLRSRIQRVFTDRTRNDVKMIARTETGAAFNFGRNEGFRQLGSDKVPEIEWVTAQDERVREGHAEADGQRRANGLPFSVRPDLDSPFEQLRYPGDTNGSAENVINCRCVVVPIARRKVEDEGQEPRALLPRRIAERINVRPDGTLLALLGPERNGHG